MARSSGSPLPLRTPGSDALRILKDTPFAVAHLPTQVRPGESFRTIVVKGTFTLVNEGTCPIAPEQHFPTGELHHDDDVERSLRYPDDLVPFKPRGECFLLGSFHAPAGQPVSFGRVAFRVGSVVKELAVFGEREWGVLGPSEPAPTTCVPLLWENAYGGPGVAENPVGRRAEAPPLFENPQALMTSPSDRVGAVGTGPIMRTWAPRSTQAGTYDATWLAHLYPHLSADVDYSFFCSAPPDQQVEGYWRGDETLVLMGVDPERPRIECQLPGVRPRVGWVFAADGNVDEVREVPIALDTLVVDAEAREVIAIWRGSTRSPEGATHVVALHQQLGEKTSLTRTAHRLIAEEAAAAVEPIVEEESGAPELRRGAPTLRGAVERQRARAAAVGPSAPPPLGAPIADAVAPALVTGLSRPASAAEELDPERLDEMEREADRARSRRIRSRGARERLEDAALRREPCHEIDLRGLDLSGLVLGELDLTGADLTDARLVGARFRGVCLDGASLDGVDLSDARFVQTSMIEASLSGATGVSPLFEDVNLRDALLDEVDWPRARFVRSQGRGADLSRAKLHDAAFDDCDFGRARAGAAELEGAVFGACRLGEAHFAEGCDLSGARFHRCQMYGLRAFDARADGLVVSESHADRARFINTSLEAASFHMVHFERADFSGARLDGARFSKALLRKARFDGASLVGAQLPGADLLQARLAEANLSGADLRGANLYRAELLGARLDGALLDLANLTGTRGAPR